MNINIVLFDDFETMDAFGPAQLFGKAPNHFQLRYLSANGDIINSSQGVKVWTDFLVPEEIEGILLIPGGKGARRLLWQDKRTLNLLKCSAENADICLMVGNGSALLAQTGLLYRRKIADFPMDENWNRMFTAAIERVKDARVVMDGKYYSCNSTAAGLDMTLWMMADLIDLDVAQKTAECIGYHWSPEDEEGIYC